MRELEIEGQPSGLGWMPDGNLLVVSMKERLVLRQLESGSIVVHADLSQVGHGWLNDMVVDSSGFAYVGNFGFDSMAKEDPRPTDLYGVTANGSVGVVASGLWFPNGLVMPTNKASLMVAETFASRLSTFRIEPDGFLSHRHTWAQFGQPPRFGSFETVLAQLTVAPDGCCIDASGNVWVADALGGRVLYVKEGGTILGEITMPLGLNAFACMLGGSDGKSLLIASAPDSQERNRVASREAILFLTSVDIPATRPI